MKNFQSAPATTAAIPHTSTCNQRAAQCNTQLQSAQRGGCGCLKLLVARFQRDGCRVKRLRMLAKWRLKRRNGERPMRRLVASDNERFAYTCVSVCVCVVSLASAVKLSKPTSEHKHAVGILCHAELYKPSVLQEQQQQQQQLKQQL